MPEIIRYQRQVPMERAVAPTVSSGWLTDQYRALGQAGQAISEVGGLIQQIDAEEQRANILDARASISAVYADVIGRYDDDTYLAGKYDLGQTPPSGVKLKPLSQMAGDMMTELKAKRLEIEGQKLGNISEINLRDWKYYADSKDVEIGFQANAQQLARHQQRLELVAYKGVEEAKLDLQQGGSLENAQAKIKEYFTMLPPSAATEHKLRAALKDLEVFSRHGLLDNLYGQFVKLGPVEGRLQLAKLKGLSNEERNELEARLEETWSIAEDQRKEIAQHEEQLIFQALAANKPPEGYGSVLDYIQRAPGLTADERSKWEGRYYEAIDRRAQGKEIATKWNVYTKLSIESTDIGRGAISAEQFAANVYDAQAKGDISGADAEKLIAKGDTQLKANQSASISTAMIRAEKALVGFTTETPQGSIFQIREFREKMGETLESEALRYERLGQYHDAILEMIASDPTLTGAKFLDEATKLRHEYLNRLTDEIALDILKTQAKQKVIPISERMPILPTYKVPAQIVAEGYGAVPAPRNQLEYEAIQPGEIYYNWDTNDLRVKEGRTYYDVETKKIKTVP